QTKLSTAMIGPTIKFSMVRTPAPACLMKRPLKKSLPSRAINPARKNPIVISFHSIPPCRSLQRAGPPLTDRRRFPRSVACGRFLELAAHIAGYGPVVPEPYGRGIERCDPPHALARRGVIGADDGRWQAHLAGEPHQGERVEHEDGVADDRQSVGSAPEADQTRGVSRQVQNLEASHRVSLADLAGDLQRPPVHVPQRAGRQRPHEWVADLREVEAVLEAAVSLRPSPLCGVAVDGRVELRGAATMVCVCVAQHDAPYPAALGTRTLDRAGGADAPRLEDGEAAVVLEQIDVR